MDRGLYKGHDYVEYGCFGDHASSSEECLYGCAYGHNCLIATVFIPNASISELAEYLVSSDHSLRYRAKDRLEKLQKYG